MKNNVKFMKNLVKVVAISVVFVLSIAGKSLAAGTGDSLNLNNIDFDNIPNDGSATGQAVTGQGTTGTSTGTSTGTTTGTQTGTTTQTTPTTTTDTTTTDKTTTDKTTTSTKSSSASKDKMPATGSNAEIIFAIGAVVLVSGAVFVFKKQSIKIK